MAKKVKKTKIEFGIKEPAPVKAKAKRETPVGKPPKRIRMLMSLANKDMAYTVGHSYNVPHEVSVNTARSWIESGAAEEDTSLDVPEETK